VGAAVRAAIEAGSTDLAAFGPPGWLDGVGLDDLDLAALVRAHAYGGGPGDFAEPHADAVRAWAGRRQWLADWRASVGVADAQLAEEVAKLLVPA
jgi:argininosuccinate lyase